jgi:hypothetical protein
MRRLFDVLSPGARARDAYPQWPSIDTGLIQAVHEVQDYYHNQVRNVHSQHLLVRLLQTLPISTSLPNQVFFDRVTDIAYRHAGELHLPSPITRGGIQHRETFFGQGTYDVLAAFNFPHEDQDIEKLAANWKWLCPVKLYRHPLVDLTISLPNGKQPDRVLGNLCVAVIDIPLLALQYKCWMEDNIRTRQATPLTIEHFISMFVLPNMIPRQVDLCLANRVFAMYDLGDLPKQERSNPFSMPRYEHRVDGIIHQYLSVVCLKSESFDQLLLALPQLDNGDYRLLIDVPPGPLTEQLGWVWLLAQLPTIRFLVQINKLSGNQRNQTYLRNLRLALLDYTSSKILSRYMPEPVLSQTLHVLQTDIIPYL